MYDLLIPRNTLVLVADGARAKLLRNAGTVRQPRFVTEFEVEQENPPTREQGTDRPGRYPGADGISRSAVEQTDWHQRAEDLFARNVATLLHRMAHTRPFKRLIVIAAPRVLGTLRAAFHPEVATRVVAEIPRDLTPMPVSELPRLLTA
jgi:protein required for attachment to host cells